MCTCRPCFLFFVVPFLTESHIFLFFCLTCLLVCPGASLTKQLSKNLGFNSFFSEKLTLIPYHKILSLNLRYFMKLAPG